MNHKSVRSAVIITPPEHFWKPIQNIRRDHDKAYERWMPHINMLYPFITESSIGFITETEELEAAISNSNIKPFQVAFTQKSFGYFQHGKRCTIWLKPLQLKDVPVKPQNQVTVTKEVFRRKEKKTNPLVPKASLSVTQSQTTQNVVKKNDLVESITIVEVDLPTPYSYLPSKSDAKVGFDALPDAFWRDNDLCQMRKSPDVIESGIDCLRYAIWQPGETSDVQKVKIVNKEEPKLRKYVRDNENSGYTKYFNSHGTSSHYRPNYHNDDDDDTASDGWTTVSSSKERKERSIPTDDIPDNEKNSIPKEGYGKFETEGTHSHPEVIRLQSLLYKTFPACDDLSKRSPEGFQAHLTLGQCDAKNVDSFMETLQRNWQDVCFAVDAVHIISRRGNDPFEIRNTVKLGV